MTTLERAVAAGVCWWFVSILALGLAGYLLATRAQNGDWPTWSWAALRDMIGLRGPAPRRAGRHAAKAAEVPHHEKGPEPGHGGTQPKTRDPATERGGGQTRPRYGAASGVPDPDEDPQ